MADNPKSEPPQVILPFFASPKEACEKLAQSRQEAARKAAAPPVTPKAQGGLWYHQQQAIETTQQSVGKARAWAAKEAAAQAAAQAAYEAEWQAAREADRKAEEAAQEAAREAATAKEAARKAANKRAAREAAKMRRWRVEQGARIKAGKEAARAFNPVTPERPDTKVAKYRPDIRHQMDVREIVAGVMEREARQQRGALERAAFFCNRLIENLFPPVSFSEMALRPRCTGLFDYGSKYEGENDE